MINEGWMGNSVWLGVCVCVCVCMCVCDTSLRREWRICLFVCDHVLCGVEGKVGKGEGNVL